MLRKISGTSRRSRSSFLTHVKSQTDGALRGKGRFRAFVRRLLWSLPWYKEIQDDGDAQIMQIATRTRTKKGIPKEAKKILIKPATSRTAEEKIELIGLLGNLYFYNRYPKKEYEQLIARTNFVSYGPGRVILQQGHMVNPWSRLYFIVSGHLSIDVATINPITLVSTSEMVKKLGPGDFFGEVAILFNDVREASITTISTVELLYITKEDFDEILKDSLEKEWSRVRDALGDLPYFFGDWSEVELRRCSIISQLKRFKEGDLILGDGFGKDKKAHFIVEGNCKVIKDIKVAVKNGRYRLIPHKDPDKDGNEERESDMNQLEKGVEIEEIYMQTNIFSKGACFGVGEKRIHRRFVAGNDEVLCLLVPQYLLLAHKRFDSYRQFLESRLFSDTALFNSFLYLRSRHQMCKKISESLKGRASIINNTTIWDVPHHYRVLSPQIGACKVPDYIIDTSLDTKLLLGLKTETDEDESVKKRKLSTTKED